MSVSSFADLDCIIPTPQPEFKIPHPTLHSQTLNSNTTSQVSFKETHSFRIGGEVGALEQRHYHYYTYEITTHYIDHQAVDDAHQHIFTRMDPEEICTGKSGTATTIVTPTTTITVSVTE